MKASAAKISSAAINYLSPRRFPRIVVFESDDWGSIRSSSASAFSELERRGYEMKNSVYSTDSIETPEDIAALEQVLMQHAAAAKSAPKFTINFVMANPDFETISKSGYKNYSYTPFFKERALFDGAALATAWAEAIGHGGFMPQLHCREHIKWWAWMKDLQRRDSDAAATYDLQMCGVPRVCSPSGTSYFQPIYVEDKFTRANPQAMAETVLEGAHLFEAHFGRRSETAIAPVAFWNDRTESLWHEAGIGGIQSAWLQNRERDGKRNHTSRYLGSSNRHGQVYLMRNCTFEPRKKGLGLERCLADIKRAFWFHKPAVISTHRVNYVGTIDPAAAAHSRKELSQLIGAILSRWPDTEFLTSDALYKRLINDA